MRDAFEQKQRRDACKKCGSTSTIVRDSDPRQHDEFPGIRYRVCQACGRRDPITKGRKR